MCSIRTRVDSAWRRMMYPVFVSLPSAVLLVTLLSVLPHTDSTISTFPLPFKTVQLLELENVLCHTPGSYLSFTVKYREVGCSLYEKYSVNVSESLGTNTALQDSTGRQWYELNYMRYKLSLYVMITGNKTHGVLRKWSTDLMCGHKGLIFTFLNRDTLLAKYSKSKTFSVPWLPGSGLKTEHDKDLMQLLKMTRRFEEMMKKRHTDANNPDVQQTLTYSTYNYVDLRTLVAILVYIFGTVVFLFVCVYSPGKKLVDLVRRRRLPRSPESHCAITSVTESLQQQQEDAPPAYDDVCRDTPPPPFSEVHNMQLLQLAPTGSNSLHLNTQGISTVGLDNCRDDQPKLYFSLDGVHALL
ncbi:uncharacterized protein LOC121859237 isoform X3 [Homarus americanus]|uniref:uncharacterized protein LOC121859237 isoform X3 n=1 Tax=Homarus americanus TaxID=6706 RepID=UPI001C44DA48|nr:uncharacterized protein LOC121859237 isoform X3 [Homarus americanus]